MPDTPSDQKLVTENWDNYWQGTAGAAAFSSGGADHPMLIRFWREFFGNLSQIEPPRHLIDIASGNGAVIATAVEVCAAALPEISCLDVSAAAVAAIRQRFPAVHGIVADAKSTGLESGRYDVATSQFGIEYAGLAAVPEMARLVAGGGWLGLLMHCHDGGIYRECAASLTAVRRLEASEFIPRASRLFEAGFAAVRGADRAPYDAAAGLLVPAIAELEAIMQEYGPHVAGDTLLQLHENVDRIHQRMAHHDPDEVLNWLSRLNAELGAFAGRMQSMCDAALDGAAFDRLCAELRGANFAIERAGPLSASANELPMAWALVARRG